MAMWIKGSNNLFNEKAFSELDDVSIDTYGGEKCYKLVPTKIDYLIPVKAKAGEKITLSMDIAAPNGIQMEVRYDYVDGTRDYAGTIGLSEVLTNFVNRKVKTLTMRKDLSRVRIDCYSIWNCTPYYIKNIMLNKGETALPYEPYYPAQRVKAVFKSKNLIPFPYLTDSIELGGVAITVNNDGTITLNGKCTEAFWFVLRNKRENPPYMIEAGTYTLSGNTHDGMVLYITDNTKQISHYNLSNRPVTFTFDEQQALYMQIRGYAGYTFDNVVLKPMLNNGTTPLPYEKYLPLTKFKAIPKSRNLIPFPYYEFRNGNVWEANGITFTLLNDGGIYVKGTATDYAYCKLANNGVLDLGATIYAWEGGTVGTNGKFTLSKYGSGAKDVLGAFDGNNKSLWLRVSPNKTIDGVVYPMLNKGDTPLPYEPPQEIWL